MCQRAANLIDRGVGIGTAELPIRGLSRRRRLSEGSNRQSGAHQHFEHRFLQQIAVRSASTCIKSAGGVQTAPRIQRIACGQRFGLMSGLSHWHAACKAVTLSLRLQLGFETASRGEYS